MTKINTKPKTKPAKKTASSTSERATRLPPDQRRMQLLGYAMKVFAEHGLGAGNHGLVAKEAKVSVPTVFFYFPTREALVDAVLKEIESLYIATYERITSIDEPAYQTLLHLTQGMSQMQDTHPYHTQIWFEWSVAARSELWPRFLKVHRYMIKSLTKLIERGQREGQCRPEMNAQDEAQIMHGTSYAIAQMKLIGARPNRVARLVLSMVQTVLTDPSLVSHPPKAETKAKKSKSPAKNSRAA